MHHVPSVCCCLQPTRAFHHLQESCGRASDASLRLLSIKDKTKLELHHFALDVPGARGGVLEAPDESEHSVPEPISWNEGLAALSPRTQSQAAQIRGMLQSALQPGASCSLAPAQQRHGGQRGGWCERRGLEMCCCKACRTQQHAARQHYGSCIIKDRFSIAGA